MAKASPLASPSATRAVLERHGAWTKHGLGQNFLVNDDVVRRILELSQVSPDDVVLEVGPGIGTLTLALLAHGRFVVSVEKDPALPPILADTLADHAGRYALIEQDALDLTAAQLASVVADVGVPAPDKLVANLPYAVAATLILAYFERLDSLQSATVMVQKEVADRIAAQPGTKAYGAYTVKLGLHAQVSGRFAVGPNNFFPPPRVESAVVRLDRAAPLMADGQPASASVVAAACTMADAAFASRRKTIANSAKTYFSGRGQEGAAIVEQLPRIFADAGIDPSRRGETLRQQEFLALGQALAPFLTAC